MNDEGGKNATDADVEYENDSDVENSEDDDDDEEQDQEHGQTSDESDEKEMVTLPRSKVKKLQDDHKNLRQISRAGRKIEVRNHKGGTSDAKEKEKKTCQKTNTEDTAIFISSESDGTSEDPQTTPKTTPQISSRTR